MLHFCPLLHRPLHLSPPSWNPNSSPTRIPNLLHFHNLADNEFRWPGSACSRKLCVHPTVRLSSSLSSSSYYNSIGDSDEFDVELGRLLALLPEEMRRRVSEHPELRDLIEVVMDMGRKPLARFPSGDYILSDYPITVEDIQYATSQVGDFAVDNRAGISRTLHRISAVRNRKGTIIGLTCRVGRAVSGSANLLRDLVEAGASLLLIGPPGVGKTTIIRDIARMLADDYQKRVMIVDTSNEIGGDGDIPHAGVGKARRMQVPHTDMQHEVLIEAVENHMPQVIVIDEIGTKLEAMAASTIAQRGIQLVATAHGVTIENLVMNPALEMLVGEVQSVTLGDEEASRRGVQKTVLERKGPSTFSCGVEIISKTELRVHRNLDATVDTILSGRYPKFEVRKINQESENEAEQRPFISDSSETIGESVVEDGWELNDVPIDYAEFGSEANCCKDEDALCVFLYGISEASMIQGIKQLSIDDSIEFTDNISEADVMLALQSKLKKNSRLQAAARSHGIPIYVAKTNSLAQLTRAIQALITDYADGYDSFDTEAKVNETEKIDALEETRISIEQIVIPKGEPVDLLPRSSNILLLQKDLIRKYKLKSERVGCEPDVRLRILPPEKQRGLDDNLKSAQNQSNRGRYPSGHSKTKFEMDPEGISRRKSYLDDDMQSKRTESLSLLNPFSQPELDSFMSSTKNVSLLPSSKWAREDVGSDEEQERKAKDLELTYSSSGSERAGDGLNIPEEVESTAIASNSSHFDGGMNEERRQKLRRLEVNLMEYREALEEEGIKSPQEIERKVATRRSRLQSEFGLFDTNTDSSRKMPSLDRRDRRDDSHEPSKKRRL